MDLISHPPYSSDLSPVISFYPRQWKNIERKEICHSGGSQNSFAGGTQQHEASALP